MPVELYRLKKWDNSARLSQRRSFPTQQDMQTLRELRVVVDKLEKDKGCALGFLSKELARLIPSFQKHDNKNKSRLVYYLMARLFIHGLVDRCQYGAETNYFWILPSMAEISAFEHKLKILRMKEARRKDFRFNASKTNLTQ